MTLSRPGRKPVEGVGTYRQGRHQSVVDGKQTKVYAAWRDMLKRCYNKSHQERFPAYAGTSVTQEWLDFQTFADWYTARLVDGVAMHLDKDLSGGKHYSPSTCRVIPARLNTLLVGKGKTTLGFPSGVGLDKYGNIIARCVDISGKRVVLGRFLDIDAASHAYKTFKYGVIKAFAEQCLAKQHIDKETYKAVLDWTLDD